MLVFYMFLTIYGTAQTVSFFHTLAINLQFVTFNCNTLARTCRKHGVHYR